MRRGRGDGDARLADLHPSRPMMQRQSDARPAARHFVGDSLEGLERERRIGFVFEKQHAASLVVVPHQPEKRDDRTVRRRIGGRARSPPR